MYVLSKMKSILAITLFAVLAQLPNLADAQADDTRTPGTSGEAVVIATVNLIRETARNEFPDDKKLLRRIALVETRDGTDNDTYRDNYYGGIWQVDEDMFNRTKDILDPESRLAFNIARDLNINWHVDITWKNLTQPLYSGLAARLFLAGIDEEIPLASNVPGQAMYWKTYYDLSSGPITEEEFVEVVTLYPDPCRIRGIDLVFLLDSSGSIGQSNFESIKEFVINIADGLEIGPNDTQVAVISYSDDAQIEFHLGEHDNNEAIRQAVSGINWVAATTATHLGLQAVLAEFNNFSRSVEKGFPRMAFVLTDGRSNSFHATLRAAEELHMANNIDVYAVGIGTNVNEEELSAIATTAENVLSTNFSIAELRELQEFLNRQACEASVLALVGQEFNGTLEDGEVVYFEYDLPEDGITLKVEVVEGYVVIYVSTQVSSPNEALNDFKLVTNTTVSVFVPPMSRSSERNRRQPDSSFNATTKVYISIEGHSPLNRFSLDTTHDDTTIPPEPPFKVKFVKDSPLVSGNSMTAFIHANKPVSDMKCRMSGTKEVKNCTDGYVQFTGLPKRGVYTLKVVAKTEEGETATIKRQFQIEEPDYCNVHLINEGVSIEGQRVMVEFTPTGDTQSTTCILDPPRTYENDFFPCKNPLIMYLLPGSHMLKITPQGCGEKRKPLKVYFEV